MVAPRTRATTMPDARPRFEAILLDLFGTLIPTGSRASRAQHLGEMARVLEVDSVAFAYEWLESFDARARGIRGSLEESIGTVASLLGGRPTPGQVQRAAAIRLDASRRLLTSCGPSLAGLDALRNAGCRLAVVSDTSDETPRLWSVSPLASRIDVTVFSCLEGVRKPDPRIYRLALGRLGLSVGTCAFVGDGGSHELTGAEAIGLPAYQYRFPGEAEDSAYRLDADEGWSGTKLSDLRELLHLAPAKPGSGAGSAFHAEVRL